MDRRGLPSDSPPRPRVMDSAASDTKATHIIAPRNSVSAVDWRTIAVLRSLAHGQRVGIIIVGSIS